MDPEQLGLSDPTEQMSPLHTLIQVQLVVVER
jgi:hypothetical protein